jgi:hypothetical protein
MARPIAWLLSLLAVGWVVASPATAHADPRTSFLADQLKTDDDYRVRTQAALALGASGDAAAVKPLCGGLKDSNVSVRVAAAAAIGKLGKSSGISCLESSLSAEKASAVAKQIKKSIAKLKGGGGASAPPPPKPGDKYYVAIDVKNKTKRPTSEIESLVRSHLQKELLAASGFAVAPDGESAQQGSKVVKSKGLTGYYLIATVQPPVYSGGNLTQVVQVSMWSYPDKALKGEFKPKLTQSGTPNEDKQSEDLLVKMCVENAVKTFKKVVASL